MNSPSLSPYKEFETLEFDRPLDGVLRITLNRPDTLNSVSADMHRELVRVWPIVSEDNNCRVVVVRGPGRPFQLVVILAWSRGAQRALMLGQKYFRKPET